MCRGVEGCTGSDVEVPVAKGSINAKRAADEVRYVASMQVIATLHAAEDAERAETLGSAVACV
jgi:hypothetical protein